MIDADTDMVTLEQQIQDHLAEHKLDAALAACNEALNLATNRYGRRDVWTALALHMLSTVQAELDRRPEAKASLKEALEVRREILGPTHPAVGSTLHQLALLEAYEDLDVAMEHCAQSLSILCAALGPKAPLSLRTRRDLVILQRRQLAVDPSAKALRLYQNARAAQDAGYHDEAEAALVEATAINRETLGDDHPHVASCLNSLGQLYEKIAKLPQAYAALREALYIRRLRRDSNPMDIALALSCLASVELAMGRAAEALLHAEEAATEVEGTAPSTEEIRRLDASVLHVLGRVYHAAGRFSEAEATFRAAMDVLGEPDPNDSQGAQVMAALLGNLAVVKGEMGRYVEAKADYRRALSLKKDVIGKDNPSYAQTAVNLAVLLSDLGEVEAAWQLLAPAVETLDRVYGEMHPKTLHARLTSLELAAKRRPNNRAPKAENEEWEKLLTAYEGGQARDVRGIAQVRRRVSLARIDRADLLGAERLLLACLNDTAKAYGEDHREVATVRHDLALLRLLQGETLAARELLETVCATLRSDDVGGFAVLHDSLLALAGINFGQDPQRARRHLDDAIQAEDRNLEAIFAAVGEDRRMDHVRQLDIVLGTYLALVHRQLADSDDARWAVAALLLRRKGLVRDVLLRERAALRAGDDPWVRQQFSELAHVRAAIARAALEGPSIGGLAHSEQELENLRRRRDELEESLLPHLTTISALRSIVAADARQIAAAVPQGAILLDYVRAPAVTIPGISDIPASYYAVILRHGHVPDVAMIGAADKVDEAVARYLEVVAVEPEGRNEPDAVRGLGAGLRELVLDGALGGVDLPSALLVSPAGHLWGVPFDALPLGTSGWVIEGCEVRYLASGRWLSVSNQQSANATSVQPVAVVGAPDFDSANPEGWEKRHERAMSAETDLWQRGEGQYPLGWVTKTGKDDNEVGFEALPGSRREAIRVGRLLGVEPALGAAATKAYLKALRSPRVLHVATHGLFISDPDELQHLHSQRLLHARSWSFSESMAAMNLMTKQMARLALELQSAMDSRTSENAESDHRAHEMAHPDDVIDEDANEQEDADLELDSDPFGAELSDPLLRSGLVMAGFNTWLLRGAIDEACGNGLLCTAEVAEMDLGGTEMVVLSACDTASGVLDHPDGVLGLRRAFAIAGARTLVLTLWSLPDEESIEMMVYFYQQLRRGVPRGEALRAAKLLLCRRGLDPFFWGSLTLDGDDGPVLQ